MAKGFLLWAAVVVAPPRHASPTSSRLCRRAPRFGRLGRRSLLSRSADRGGANETLRSPLPGWRQGDKRQVLLQLTNYPRHWTVCYSPPLPAIAV